MLILAAHHALLLGDDTTAPGKQWWRTFKRGALSGGADRWGLEWLNVAKPTN